MSESPRDPGQMDDLKQIKGIKESREQWLRDELDIQTYADLAEASADEIEALLRAKNQILAEGEVEEWIRQAKELVAEQPPVPNPTPPVRAAENRLVEDWKSLAIFIVDCQLRTASDDTPEQQTLVSLTESDANGSGEPVPFSGWAEPEAGDWMRRLVEKRAAPMTGPVGETQPARITTSPQIAINLVEVFQPTANRQPLMAGSAQRSFQGSINAHESFMLRAQLIITGTNGREEEADAHYSVTFSVDNMTSGMSSELGTSKPQPLAAHQQIYLATPVVSTLPTGLYTLRVIAKLSNQAHLMSYIEIPLFHVI